MKMEERKNKLDFNAGKITVLIEERVFPLNQLLKELFPNLNIMK